MKPKQKGDVAVGEALNYFLKNDYEVFLPIGDKRDFDIIVEKNNKLSRVQIKYAGNWGKSRKYVASLRVMGGNQSFYSSKKYSAANVS